jgi:hypothetical protein
MPKRLLGISIIAMILMGASFGCNPSGIAEKPTSFAGSVLVVGEEYGLYWDMNVMQTRVTDMSVGDSGEVVHRDDIATISGSKITMLKSGEFLLWRCDTNYSEDWFSQRIISLDLQELRKVTIQVEQFETNLYFPMAIKYGEPLPYALCNRNISGEILNITRGYGDPFGGTPNVTFFIIIDGYKVIIGDIMHYPAVMSYYSYLPDGVFKTATYFNSVINRNMVYKDGTVVAEDDPIYAKLGFATIFQNATHIKNEQLRKVFLEDLRKALGDDWLNHPDYNSKWMEFYDAHPTYDEAYQTISAPKGLYHIQLSTGQVIENVLTIA